MCKYVPFSSQKMIPNIDLQGLMICKVAYFGLDNFNFSGNVPTEVLIVIDS